ncbi:MAG TPA: hypothetical protein VEK56_00505 [Vicinamibacterales bacterium]|nr:hypothetical protein [Vicinamibacterales bacterium]
MAVEQMSEQITRRHLFRRELHPLRSVVASAVAAADPARFLALGAPGDEYEKEVEALVPRLLHARSRDQVQVIIRDEFARRFGEDVAGPPERYLAASDSIWEALRSPR